MKYQVIQLLTDPPQYRITGPNCQFDFGWDRSTVAHHVCGELNRLNGEVDVQVEAKNNALRKVADLEALGVEMELKLKGTPSNRALKQRLGVRNSQVRELLDVLERCQGILADYLDPSAGIKPRAALNHLLDILDDGAFVTRINHLSEMLKKRPLGWEIDNGSVELTKEDKLAVLKALDDQAKTLRLFMDTQPASYAEACRILGASEDGDVANGARDPSQSIRPNPNTAPWWATHLFQDGSDCQWYFGKSHENGWIDAETFSHASRLWTPHNIIAGTLHPLPIIPHVNRRSTTNELPLCVGDEMLVSLKRMPDGKQYVSGLVLRIEQPFIVHADQVFINGAALADRDMPNPTEADLESQVFNAIWDVIKSWDVNVPGYYRGYCGANGSHVKLILDKLTSAISATQMGEALHEGFERVVNNTTNHFAPSKKLKRRVKELRARVSELENERDELLSEIRADSERD